MGKPRIIKESHNVGFYVMEAYEGKTIEQRCREMVETGEPIKDTSPLIYTPKEKGVRPEYNVRAAGIVTGKGLLKDNSLLV